LAEGLSGWQARYPGVRVQRSGVRAKPGEALVQASGRARLVVVGAGGRGEVAELLLGSVGRHLLHHTA